VIIKLYFLSLCSRVLHVTIAGQQNYLTLSCQCVLAFSLLKINIIFYSVSQVTFRIGINIRERTYETRRRKDTAFEALGELPVPTTCGRDCVSLSGKYSVGRGYKESNQSPLSVEDPEVRFDKQKISHLLRQKTVNFMTRLATIVFTIRPLLHGVTC
jgi:hypothetical protein